MRTLLAASVMALATAALAAPVGGASHCAYAVTEVGGVAYVVTVEGTGYAVPPTFIGVEQNGQTGFQEDEIVWSNNCPIVGTSGICFGNAPGDPCVF